MKPPKYKAADVDVIDRTRVHDGYFRIDAYRLRHRQFDGSWGPEVRREIFERGHAVGIMPYDPKTDRVVLIEQFRPGAYAAFESGWFGSDATPWLYECVAGIIDPGEQPETVARREMLEEAGVEVSDMIRASHYFATPGGSSESVFLYIGRVDASAIGGVHGVPGEGEDIRPFALSLDEAYAGIEAGLITNAMTIIGLQWLMLNRAEVQARWSAR